MSITPILLQRLSLPEIGAVVFYKRDDVTTDLICCQVEVAGEFWTFHEELPGWADLIVHLSALSGFRADWHEAVVRPQFEASETVAFRRWPVSSRS